MAKESTSPFHTSEESEVKSEGLIEVYAADHPMTESLGFEMASAIYSGPSVRITPGLI
jgi:hypothetical protein